jgi:hypothetical protein
VPRFLGRENRFLLIKLMILVRVSLDRICECYRFIVFSGYVNFKDASAFIRAILAHVILSNRDGGFKASKLIFVK